MSYRAGRGPNVGESLEHLFRPWLVFLSLLPALGACGTTRINGTNYVTGCLDPRFDGVCGHLAEDTTIGGVVYKKGTSVRFDLEGRLRSVWLVVPTLVQGRVYTGQIPKPRPMSSERLGFSEDGRVVQGMLGASAVIYGITFPPETEVVFRDDGSLHYVVVDPITVKGITYVGYLSFMDNGQVYRGWLARDTIINGVMLKKLTRVEFWPSGRLQSGTIAEYLCVEPSTELRVLCPMDRIGYPPGKLVEFAEDGRVVKVSEPLIPP